MLGMGWSWGCNGELQQSRPMQAAQGED